MDRFLEELANKKWRYYYLLYKKKPQAHTQEECFERIQFKAKYEEVLDIINMLPPKESIKVRELYDNLAETFE